jgi:hypothetical protein
VRIQIGFSDYEYPLTALIGRKKFSLFVGGNLPEWVHLICEKIILVRTFNFNRLIKFCLFKGWFRSIEVKHIKLKVCLVYSRFLYLVDKESPL